MGQTGLGICFSDDTLPEISKLRHDFNDIFQAEEIPIKTVAKMIHKKILNLNIEIHINS